MSQHPRTTRRTLIVLSPLIVWLAVGALAVYARPSVPEPSAFCRRADSVVFPATRSWNAAHPDAGAAEDPEGFAVHLAQQIDRRGLAAAAPEPMRPVFAEVARDLPRAEGAPRGSSAAQDLARTIDRLLAAYQQECARPGDP